MSALRGSADIRRLSGIVDARRSRSPHGALLEMSMLEMERQRLAAEAARAVRRCEEIAVRIAEIERRQQRLQRFVERREPAREPLAASTSSSPKTPPVISRRLAY